MKAVVVKQILYDIGADLCGIASIDRFDDAPEGFHPLDVLPSCKSIIAFAKKFSVGTLHCNTTVPYTITRNFLSHELDAIAFKFCETMEDKGVLAVQTGAIGPTKHDPRTDRFRNIVSAKHCAVASGLGRIGRNSLLVTPEYGNMVWINAVLTNAELEPDEMLTGSLCNENCSICVDVCPVKALDGNPEINQFLCFEHSYRTREGEEFNIRCHKCRTLCPNCFGSKNIHMKPRTL